MILDNCYQFTCDLDVFVKVYIIKKKKPLKFEDCYKQPKGYIMQLLVGLVH